MGRIRQAMMDVTAGFHKADYEFVDGYLNPGEKELFLQLRQGEILHSIAVARKLAELIKTAFQPPLEDRERFYIIKAGLLHDLGKIHYGMNVLEKSLAVLLAKLGFDRGKRIARSRMMEIYYRHPDYSRELVLAKESFAPYPYLYKIISLHHQKSLRGLELNSKETEVWRLLQTADDES